MEGDIGSGEGRLRPATGIEPEPAGACRRRWFGHAAHDQAAGPRRPSWASLPRPRPSRGSRAVSSSSRPSDSLILLDGSHGEGGGQILRTALTLSLLTGRPFRISKIRANREKPGLRPQHKAAVEAAAMLGRAEILGCEVGSRDLVFRPGKVEARDLVIDIGTAGSTGMVLQTLHLPMGMRSETACRLTLIGGTFNPKAPPSPFLERTWRGHLANFGMPVALSMTSAGFYPRGGGRLEAWIEPATPKPWVRTTRGELLRIRGVAGASNLPEHVANRMRDRAVSRLSEAGLNVELEIETTSWPSIGQGAAIALAAEHAGAAPATFVGIGERGKPAETVADEAVDELLDFLSIPDGAVDPHSADQILLPLALAEGRSVYTVSHVTEHLRTNVATIRAFLDRPIEVEEPLAEGRPGRVVVG